MKRLLSPYLRASVVNILIFLLPALPLKLLAQVSCSPAFPNVNDNVTITFDASQGNGALAGVSPVYAHMGVITDKSTAPTDWKYVATTWGIADPKGQMTNDGPNIWKKTFQIKSFFNIPANETVLQLAFVFRNTNGSIVGRAFDGSDIFYPVYPDNVGLQTIFTAPSAGTILSAAGNLIPIKAEASVSADLQLFDNGQPVISASGKVLETQLSAATGIRTVEFVATTATDSDTSRFTYIVPNPLTPENPPAGTELGINYVDAQTVRLALYAPNKQVVHVIGDFNDWKPNDQYQMRRSLDGNTWWIELGGLQAGEIYRFQYLVNGSLKIADPLSTLVLDPGNDPFIPSLTYPNLPAYPAGKTFGAVTVLQTAQTPFNWQANNYTRPKKTDLVVYELLVRDFLQRHDYPTLLDTLDYLEKLGVTAIELMPVNEFDGNISWGYNPAYHKALDKFYGTADALKRFIDACHERGIAVIIDVVFNQASGSSPLAQLYWDGANNRPAADNPWLNPEPTHDFNVFNDFNHESQATKEYVKNCIRYWMTEFRVDGFRFDLSKGFTQKKTLGSTSAWGQYDASRIAIWKDYANFMWAIDPDFYVILEHFAANNEEKELAEYGMMLWGNMHGAYKEVALGYSAGIGTSLTGISHKQRGWAVPHLIGYMESHDEERIAYECKTYGNATGNYNVKSPVVTNRRIEMLANLLYTIPGPKMLWQFGELGYDFPINYCPNGTINPACRVDPKPIRWDYYNDPYRRRLHDVTAALLHLRKNYDVFETADFQANIGSGQIRTIYLNHPDMNVAVVANVGISGATATVNFQHTGEWYEYYTTSTLNVSGASTTFLLGPGEYRLYLDQPVALPGGLNPTPASEAAGLLAGLEVYPNPVADRLLIDFSLEQGTEVLLEVFDATGRRLAMPWSGYLPAGAQQIAADASSWGPGFYWLTVSDANGGRLTRKVVK